MRSIVARGVNFGVAVAYMISAEQRAIETVGSTCISAGVPVPVAQIRAMHKASQRVTSVAFRCSLSHG